MDIASSVIGAKSPGSDLQLAIQSAAGDPVAFEQLYREHYRRVYTLCYRMLGNTAEAEELTQDVFLQVYRKVGTFKGNAAFSSWLHRLAVNTVLMYMRKKKRMAFQAPITEVDLHQIERSAHHDTGSVALLNRVLLEEAIKALPVGYRTVFILHDVMGYNHKEISEMLATSRGAAKTQLHRARMRLRQLLGETLRRC